MSVCPACSQTVTPNDLTCPKCGISLHPGTGASGPASESGKALSIAAIVAAGLIFIILLLGCLGAIGWSLFGYSAARVGKPTWSGIPAGSTIVYDVEETMDDVPEDARLNQPPENEVSP